MDKLEELLRHPADVYCLQETGRLDLSEGGYLQELAQLHQLTVAYSPRARGGRGGGTAVLYSSRCFAVRSPVWTMEPLGMVEVAQVWLEFRAAPASHFVIASVYAPPAVPADVFRRDMQQIFECPAANTILVGDFNATHISWDKDTRESVSASTGSRLVDMLERDHARFHVSAPPKHTCRHGITGSTVDFFLCSGECYPVQNIEWAGYDHSPIRGTCYLDDMFPVVMLTERVHWRPNMPVRWSKVTEEDKIKFQEQARIRFRR